MTPGQWKEFYRREHETLGVAELIDLLDRAPIIATPQSIIFPHTRLSASGHLIAAAAASVARSGREVVLALGVLHGRDRSDPARRGIYGPEVESEEFSLDNFTILLELAAKRAGRRSPRVVKRYPFLSGEAPTTLEGFDELKKQVEAGAMVVATTDPVHHGAGYNTPADQQLPREMARDTARKWIENQLNALSQHDYRGFLKCAADVNSDFRDVGPVLAELVDLSKAKIVEMELVDYTDVLDTPPPTWVAAALITT